MNSADYWRKVYGGWLGKAVGGTLGGPYEGSDHPLNLSFYDPVPTQMLPNDDLDLQVVWACRLATDWEGVVSRRNFERAWLENIHFCWDEYGVAIRNLRLGYHAPQSGSYDNFYASGMGAAIRSELWACLAPGDPGLAAKFCYEDACLDHAGDGIYAEQFLAAMESVAFVDTSIPHAIDAGLAVIPAESLLGRAIRETCQWCADLKDFWKVRENIMANYGVDNFTDVVMNLAMEVAALLLCDDDFSKAICLAVNGGNDTDCTGATVGAFLGIRNPECIDGRWLKPIGNALVLSKEITGLNPPADLAGFTDMVVSLHDRVSLQPPAAEEAAPARRIAARICDLPQWSNDGFGKTSPVFDDCAAHSVEFGGNFIDLDLSGLAPGAMRLVKVPFRISLERDAKVMVNSHLPVAVWVDGKPLFTRGRGIFAPSFNRSIPRHSAVIHLGSGVHELLFGVMPDGREPTDSRLVFGVGDTANFWLTDAF